MRRAILLALIILLTQPLASATDITENTDESSNGTLDGNYTVKDGATWTISGHYIIEEGTSITVEDGATMVVSGDLFKIYFDKDVDLKLIKENLTNKQNRLEQEMNKISQRLENKSFVDRAPKEIVEQEKNNYNNLKNDIEKISVTIKGI